MTTYKIESGIPLPSPRGRGGTKYPFADMNVGDSVFFPKGTDRAAVNTQVQRMKPKTFAIRKVMENGSEGFRVWRTS